MILATHAFASWLRQNDIDPAEITLVLRAKTPEAERALAGACAKVFLEHTHLAATPIGYPDGRAHRLRIHGLDVLVTSLDTSARKVEG